MSPNLIVAWRAEPALWLCTLAGACHPTTCGKSRAHLSKFPHAPTKHMVPLWLLPIATHLQHEPICCVTLRHWLATTNIHISSLQLQQLSQPPTFTQEAIPLADALSNLGRATSIIATFLMVKLNMLNKTWRSAMMAESPCFLQFAWPLGSGSEAPSLGFGGRV